MEPSPVYSSTRHVYIDMDPKSRRRELNELVEVPCINKNNYGVDRTYIKAAFKALLGRKTNEYGVRHGVMREVTDIFVLWRETGAPTCLPKCASRLPLSAVRGKCSTGSGRSS